ncbi:hypothetical protein BGZ73_008754 [Actinomortierella ambigua]|nr:hypothetical protein BGZ73_008754 [Actinomortierella ambigua]
MDSTLSKAKDLSLEEQANVGPDLDPAAFQPHTNRSSINSAEEGSAVSNGTDVSDSSADQPKAARRKSSLVTLESKLHRIPSAEKHVTIQLDDDNKIDMDGDHSGNLDDVSQPDTSKHESESLASLRRSKEQDEASKKELAKILEQFDPLGESSASTETAKENPLGIDEIVIQDRGIAPSKLKAPVNKSKSKRKEAYDEKELSASMSPNLSNSGESSPIALGSPQTSYDVLMPPINSSEGNQASSSPSLKPEPSIKKKGGDSFKSRTGRDVERSKQSEAGSSQENPKTAPFDFHKFLEQMRHRSATPLVGYFKSTFSPNTADDAERDNVLSQKIQIFRWIREEHLDIPKTPHNEAYLNYAQSELKKINSFKAPRDKVICILNCCKFIFTLIRRSEGSAKGADTFLPILIYVVIRANPPQLVSNVQFISRFRNPEKLQAEAGYYLASLMGAISFIENLEAGSLSITPEEFDEQIEKTMRELEQEKRAAEQKAQQQKQQEQEQQQRHQRKISGRDDSHFNEKSAPRDASPQQRGGGKFSFFGSSASTASQANAGSGRRDASAALPQEEFNEKAALKQEMQRREREQQQQQRQQQQQQRSAGAPTMPKEEPSSSFSPWTSIVNPAAALIEMGAQTASRTIQKPMQFMEKIFLESDEEEMAKPYPARPVQQQSQQQSPARPPAPSREDSFGEFMYVPAGEEYQVPSPSQQQLQPPNHIYPGALGGSSMEFNQEQRARSRTVSGSTPIQPQAPQQPQQQPQQPQMTREQYNQALETLRDMFPTCERQVIDTILQANEGRVTPSIDNLLEIASTADQQQQQQQQDPFEPVPSTIGEGLDSLAQGPSLLVESDTSHEREAPGTGSDIGALADATPRSRTDDQHSTNTDSTAGKASTHPPPLPQSDADNQERELPSHSSPSPSKQESASNDLISF